MKFHLCIALCVFSQNACRSKLAVDVATGAGAAASNISFADKTLSVPVGSSKTILVTQGTIDITLQAKVVPSNNNILVRTYKTSSGVVTKVTGIASGTSQLTASYGAMTADSNVRVTDTNANILSPNTPTLAYDVAGNYVGLANHALSLAPSKLAGNGGSIYECLLVPGSNPLPSGVTLASDTCVISGTPTSLFAITPFQILVLNDLGNSTIASISLGVASTASAPTLGFGAATGTTGNVNSLMTVTPSTLNNNGTSITSCGVKSGSTALPAGLSVNPFTCVISGTPTSTLTTTNYTLVATNAAGTSTAATVQLTINAAIGSLSVTSISPTIGPSIGGTTITITGQGFTADATVTVGGVACTSVTVVTSTQITCVTPAVNSALANVAVTQSSGTSQLSGSFYYLVTHTAFVDGGGATGINHDSNNDSVWSSGISFQSKLYLATAESGKIRVAVYNGNDTTPVWTFVDGNTANGINFNNTRNATYPNMTIFSNKLYVTWGESNGSGWSQVRASVYNGNDSSPTWTTIDGGGATGISRTATSQSIKPRFAVVNSKLYATWEENPGNNIDQIRVAVYNGNDSSPSWSFVDGNAATTGINKNTGLIAYAPYPMSFNNKLYIAWNESVDMNNNYMHVAVYNGNDSSPSWSFIDGASGIYYSSNNSQASVVGLAIANSKLYATWAELDNGSTYNRIRVAVYNGNDSSPTWALVDGNNAFGLNYSHTQQASYSRLGVVNNNLYTTWVESNGTNNQIRLAAYNGNDSSPSWTFADGNAANGINHDVMQDASVPIVVESNAKLYVSWTEYYNNLHPQERVAVGK